MITAKQFCDDFAKDLVMADPYDRKAIAAGYAKTLEAMLEAAMKGAEDEPEGE